MEAVKNNDVWFLRLEKGEELFETLETWAQTHEIKSGHLSGIGALQDTELGAYYLDKKEYGRKVFPDICELLSLEGNLSFNNDKPSFKTVAFPEASVWIIFTEVASAKVTDFSLCAKSP